MGEVELNCTKGGDHARRKDLADHDSPERPGEDVLAGAHLLMV
jgi:hypothetical protein